MDHPSPSALRTTSPILDADRLMAGPLAVIGLGYVGLPLAVEFGKVMPTLGFDINDRRLTALSQGHDQTGETAAEDRAAAKHLTLTGHLADLATARVFVITVPTPIDASKRPDLGPLLRASWLVSGLLKRGDLVIYESTVYPGATEEDCVPVLQRGSGLRYNQDFFVGYSPERINPGDPDRRLPSICKVTSGSTPAAALVVDRLYKRIITAGTWPAESIRVAEAAKVIENTQRDLNIALINEVAIICNRLGIETDAVLQAAGTKWNFLPFRPGLVGGHCIGVDPYYLTHRAEAAGYHPQVILAGRRINDTMPSYVAGQMVKAMLRRHIQIEGARLLLLGLSFKENCPDLRGSRIYDLYRELREFGMQVDVHDPLADPEEARRLYGIDLIPEPADGHYDGLLLAVAHQDFARKGAAWIRGLGRQVQVLYDLKSLLPRTASDLRL